MEEFEHWHQPSHREMIIDRWLRKSLQQSPPAIRSLHGTGWRAEISYPSKSKFRTVNDSRTNASSRQIPKAASTDLTVRARDS
jgi:hypothetical protein